MASLETTPAPVVETKRRFVSRRFLLLLVIAGMLLTALTAVLLDRAQSDQMRRRFVGVWESEHRRFEFHPDGYLRSYRREDRGTGLPQDSWHISDGDLVLVSGDSPLPKNASFRRRVEGAAQRLKESLGHRNSARFDVEVEGADTITVTLVEEWGAAPKHYQRVTMKRVSEQLPP
jgi:hypothetical protein